MKKRRQHVSGDKSGFDLIPVDLVINTLSRLPVKSLAKCRCVSKLWSSIIRRPNYNQLFPIKSPATPRFLFIVETGAFGPRLFFSSSPQPQNPDKISTIEATLHTKSATDYCRICPPVNGLVCRQHTGENYTYAVICNPITGEYVTTPKLKTERFHDQYVLKHRSMTLMEKMYFGYDPIEEQFKVLCMTWLTRDSNEYQVLTLGTVNLSWRKIQCGKLHYHLEENHDDDAICINGLLYYQAIIDQKRSIVCFDVRSEKFSFVNVVDDYFLTKVIWQPLILINYKNKLGAIHGDTMESDFFLMWVLENAEEHKWSDHFYKIPEVPRGCFSAAMIGSGEIVFYRNYATNFHFIRYYNLEKNVITGVCFSVPALEYVEYGRIHTYPNFVEDVKLM